MEICLPIFFLLLGFGRRTFANLCDDPPPPQNGHMSCPDGTGHFSLCSVRCNAGYVISGPSHQMCWCRGGSCSWKGGGNSFCEDADCDMPFHDNGRVLLADKWHGGLGAVVEFKEIPTNVDINYGWSIVIVFDRPLGKNASITSWNTHMTASSYEGQTFTIVNAQHNEDLTASLGSETELKVLFVVNNVEGDMPKAAYVGLYDTKIRDATCVLAPRMPLIAPVGSPNGVAYQKSTLETPTVPPTTTLATTTTTKKSPPRKPKPNRRPRRPRYRNRKPKKPKTTTAAATTTTTATTTTVATTTTTTTKATTRSTTTATRATIRPTPPPTTPVFTTVTPLPSEGRYCNLQQGADAYISEKAWTDRGEHSFTANAKLTSTEFLKDWSMVIVFDTPVKSIQVWACQIIDSSADGLIWTFGPFSWDAGLNAGEKKIDFIAQTREVISGSASGQVFLCSDSFTSGDALMKPENKQSASVTGEENEALSRSKRQAPKSGSKGGSGRCAKGAKNGTPVSGASQIQLNFSPNNDGTKYNYNELIHKSILFFEAQRSGKLPPDQRVSWRGDSGLKDGCDAKEDASGGWYDAGNYVKYNFPMSFSLTTLAWGGIVFRDAYQDAGELQNMINAIKWPTRYLIKCHTSKFEFIGQVGTAEIDDGNWGRPEEMTMRRKTFKISANKPGTELAAEAAAALAASSIFLKTSDAKLSADALKHAKELYEFADTYRGMYHLAIPDAVPHYQSYSGYQDELVWAAAWMYKATNDNKYLKAAGQFYQKMNGQYAVEDRYAWDRKLVGAQALLAEMTGSDIYRNPLASFLDNLETSTETPKGMYFLDEWAPNRYTSGAAFIALVAGQLVPHLPREIAYMRWAEDQMGKILGDTGRSFVVGFGKNYPKKARHRASSCPPFPQKCDWSTYGSATNHYILYGAMVGGPDEDGVFHDDRENAKENHVACDYNAVFQSAIAGLKHYAMKKRGKVPAARATKASTTQANAVTKPSTVSKGPTKPPRTPAVSVFMTKPTAVTSRAATTKPQRTRPTVSEATRCSRTSPVGVPMRNAMQTTLNFKQNNDGTKHNYNKVLHLSLLFFEAQMAGRLPPGHRVPWRGDSTLKDGCGPGGADVSGGWFDAGDHVKFGFPMAFSLTTLAWGGIAFRDAYTDSGELQNMINTVTWGTKFFMNAHTSKYVLIGQVGNGKIDHASWGRPESMSMRRPVYKITAQKPGTELAAEAAAGLAASSIFLKDTDPQLAAEALRHAEELYDFADKYRGLYHESIKDAKEFYKSVSGYDDELIWGAAWLYKATDNRKYLTMASNNYKRIKGKYVVETRYSWDRKLCGAQALLGQLTGHPDYTGPFFKMIDGLMKAPTTPQGLHFLTKWGSNRYAAGAAFMAAIAAQMNPPRKVAYRAWAKKQLDLMLGDAGKSFVVGYGNNYPKRPHHRSSSCPPYPQRCDWATFNSPSPNHYILHGALVGGPDAKGKYVDKRSLYEQTEVTTDYNACFQSAAAGVKHFAMKSRPKGPVTPKPSTTKAPKPAIPPSKKPIVGPKPTKKPGPGPKSTTRRPPTRKPPAGRTTRKPGTGPKRTTRRPPTRRPPSGRPTRRPGTRPKRTTRRPPTRRPPTRRPPAGRTTRKPRTGPKRTTRRPPTRRRPGGTTRKLGTGPKRPTRRPPTRRPPTRTTRKPGVPRPRPTPRKPGTTKLPCKPPKSKKCMEEARVAPHTPNNNPQQSQNQQEQGNQQHGGNQHQR